MQKTRVVAIVGPTASGKTALGVQVARLFDGEVISADSMQVYNNMPIASAAPTAEETMGIKHHLVGFLNNDDKFSVAGFIDLAAKAVDEIAEKGKLPVIVGGTGLYVDSFLQGVRFTEEDCSEIRERLEQEAEEKGTEVLLKRLCEIDSEAAQKLHVNDRKRIIRALEVYELHGKTPTEINAESKPNEEPYDAIYIGITFKDRQKLYDRINERVDVMLQNGLLEEAKTAYLSPKGQTAVQAIGHKEFFKYFDGEISLEEAVEKLKTETRRYAKRQLTWFRRNEKINWIYADETDDVVKKAKEIIENY